MGDGHRLLLGSPPTMEEALPALALLPLARGGSPALAPRQGQGGHHGAEVELGVAGGLGLGRGHCRRQLQQAAHLHRRWKGGSAGAEVQGWEE